MRTAQTYFLPLLTLALTALLAGCQPPPVKARKLHRVDPDAVTDRRGWVVLESGKKVATIYHRGTVHDERNEGSYVIYDSRNESDTGQDLIGYINGQSGQITQVGAGLDGDQTRTTQEVVDVTSNRGLIQAVRFLMRLGGPLDIDTAGEFSRRAK